LGIQIVGDFSGSIFRILWQYRENWPMLDMWQKSQVGNVQHKARRLFAVALNAVVMVSILEHPSI
jgi:hypothetical protein